MASWLPIPSKSHFSLANIPFGIISTSAESTHRPAIAIGQHVLDLSAFAQNNGFSKLADFPADQLSVFSQTTLNDFAALGRPVHRATRAYLQDIFRQETPYPEILKDNESLRKQALIPIGDVRSHLPLSIGDYTDFFAGRNHAHTVGTLFRGAANALQPNYNHLPVAYHGRASSVVVSGTPLHRPWGQVLPNPQAKEPVFQPCARLDIELELGMFISKGNKLGAPVDVNNAEEYIFGYVLMNDWSARDIQQWEYVPLGPFNAKNFGTTISPWVVLADALEGFRGKGLENEVPPKKYLDEKREDPILDINLEVSITTAKGNKTKITQVSSQNLLWSWPQMIAHHSVSGCNLRTGDLLGSGTISGLEPGTQGSLLEQTMGGKQFVKLEGGEERKFIQDGDSITITGWSGTAEDGLVGFGECEGTIIAAVPRD
ncbi:putative fumarylacetoacetate hydrolase [Fusarium proliferatum ET1]|uniref:Fumarylacetoacetase n=1 Tax=Fusarium proliferatum (strain ET1) TaxID=1227346 RepID=A0A1L7VHB3_FUSPR|nr:putative fumarylacetoacetate hydrolase [Fusarium proliferatum ET1]CZR39146.1 probable fumarylacetoacetate hydrolase [Fusarium proliferatum ET1]